MFNCLSKTTKLEQNPLSIFPLLFSLIYCAALKLVIATAFSSEKLIFTKFLNVSCIFITLPAKTSKLIRAFPFFFVILVTDMPHRTWKAYEKDPDDDTRVFYVGLTRAKQNLHIVQPVTNKYFMI